MPSYFQLKNPCWNVFSCLSMRLTAVSSIILRLAPHFNRVVAATRFMWEAAITLRWLCNRSIRSKDGGGMYKFNGGSEALKLNTKRARKQMRMRCRQGKMKSKMQTVLLKILKNKTLYGLSGRNITCSTSWNSLHKLQVLLAQKKSQKAVRI